MHLPVLKEEVLKYLDPKPNENFIDCTAGQGGHMIPILEKIGPKGRIMGIEINEQLYEKLKSKTKKFQERTTLINDSYSNLKETIEKEKFSSVSGILFDLGFSSWHMDESGTGFSFRKDEFLDMRYSTKEKDDIKAWDIINDWPKQELEEIFKKYGEERFSKIIAQRIIEKREIKKIDTTLDLSEIIKESIPLKFQKKKIHPATKVFQALRIVVNDELENLEKSLPQAIDVLKKNGRIVVISFHSLEDRIVKHFFKDLSKENKIKILTKKPIMADEQETEINPRSRSAKLRAIQLI